MKMSADATEEDPKHSTQLQLSLFQTGDVPKGSIMKSCSSITLKIEMSVMSTSQQPRVFLFLPELISSFILSQAL